MTEGGNEADGVGAKDAAAEDAAVVDAAAEAVVTAAVLNVRRRVRPQDQLQDQANKAKVPHVDRLPGELKQEHLN